MASVREGSDRAPPPLYLNAAGKKPILFNDSIGLKLLDADLPALTDTSPMRSRRTWRPSPTIDRLRPKGDESASRVLARHQALALENDHDAELAGWVPVMSAMARPLYRCRRHSMDSFNDVRRLCHRHLTVGRHTATTREWSGLDHSRADPYQATCSLGIDPGHLTDDGIGLAGIVHLRCTVTILKRNAVALGWYPLCPAWRQHAAERVLERGTLPHGTNVHSALAVELARLSSILTPMADIVRAHDEDAQLPVPFAGGLLLGSMDVAQPGIAASRTIHCLHYDGSGTGVDRFDAGERSAQTLHLRRPVTWTALTFIGPDGLTRAQRAYIEAFKGASDDFRIDRIADLAIVGAWETMNTFGATTQAMGRPVIAREDAFFPSPRTIERRSNGATSEPETAETNLKWRERAETVARLAVSPGMIRIEAQGRRISAAYPIRYRDHDDDPARRVLRAFAKT